MAYFSRTGNTRMIAGQIGRSRKADMFEIIPTAAYPEDYEETVSQAERERRSGYRPPLKSKVEDMAVYGTVFLGFPIWGMTAPAVIRSFCPAMTYPAGHSCRSSPMAVMELGKA